MKTNNSSWSNPRTSCFAFFSTFAFRMGIYTSSPNPFYHLKTLFTIPICLEEEVCPVKAPQFMLQFSNVKCLSCILCSHFWWITTMTQTCKILAFISVSVSRTYLVACSDWRHQYRPHWNLQMTPMSDFCKNEKPICKSFCSSWICIMLNTGSGVLGGFWFSRCW